MEVIEYKMGDKQFKPPEYETHISHVLLLMFGILTAGSQIAITMGVLPGSFWPVPVASFLGGFASYIWIYFAMEHIKVGVPVIEPIKLEIPELIPTASISEVIPDIDANTLINGIIDRLPTENKKELESLPFELRKEAVSKIVQETLVKNKGEK